MIDLYALREWVQAEIREALRANEPAHNKSVALREWETADYKFQQFRETFYHED